MCIMKKYIGVLLLLLLLPFVNATSVYLNDYVAGNNYLSGVSISGSNTKTVVFNRVGLSDLSYSFSDLNNVYGVGSGLYLSGDNFYLNQSFVIDMIDARILALNIVNGTDGINGTNGVNGVNGTDGLNGSQGIQGIQGVQGVAGINGTDGINGTNASVVSGDNFIDVINGVITFNQTKTNGLYYDKNLNLLGFYNSSTLPVVVPVNTSFNQSLTDSLYYNKTTNPLGFYNSSNVPTLDVIGNPVANKDFSMANRDLNFSFNDGSFNIEQKGAFNNDLLHLHQHTGNAQAGSDLLHLEASDTDVVLINATGNRDIVAYFNGNISIEGSKVCTQNNGLCSSDERSINGTDIRPRDINFTGELYDSDKSFWYNHTEERLCIGSALLGDCTDSSNTKILVGGDFDSYGNSTMNTDLNSYAGLSISTSLGTSLNPLANNNGDFIGGVRWYSYNGSSYNEDGSIRGYVNNVTSNHSMNMVFNIDNENETREEILRINSTGLFATKNIYTANHFLQHGVNVLDYQAYFCDFMSNAISGTMCLPNYNNGIIGTAGAMNNVLNPSPNRIGVVSLSVGTGANSGWFIQTNPNVFQLNGNEIFSMGAGNFSLAQGVSTGTNTTVFKGGFLDSNTSSAVVDGVYFEQIANTTNITGGCIALNNSVRNNSISNFTIMSGNNWYEYSIVINPTGSRANCTIYNATSGVQLWSDTVSNTIPLVSTGVTGSGVLIYRTVSGTALPSASIDYINTEVDVKRRLLI